MAHKTIKHGGTRVASQTEEKRKKNPINNQEFYEELCEYLAHRKSEVDAGREIPQIPNSLGNKIFMVAEMLSKKFYFIGYSYREDMVGDAVLNCFQYIDKYDTAKKNPFAYFTQTCFYAFLRRIQSEKKQTYTKAQIVKNLGSVFEELTLHESNLDAEYKTTIGEILGSQVDPNLDRLFAKKPKAAKAAPESVFDLDLSEELDETSDSK